jgi:hypothetical protein
MVVGAPAPVIKITEQFNQNIFKKNSQGSTRIHKESMGAPPITTELQVVLGEYTILLSFCAECF